MSKFALKKIKNKRGSALAFALVMVVIVAIILSSLLVYITSQISYSKDSVERERAFQIAESGIYYYKWYLAHEVEGKTAQQIQTFWQTGNPYGVSSPYVVEVKDPEGGPIGKYSLTVTQPAVGSTIVNVTSTGWTYAKPSAQRVIQVRFRRPSWSENIVLANDNMRFGQGTTVNGKIFSNQGIRFDGVATNVVSSALASYQDPDHVGGPEFGVHTHVNAPPGSGTNDAARPAEEPPAAVPSRTDVFQAGRDFPVPQVDFASVVSDISFMRSSASIKYDNSGKGRRIILKANGTFDMCKVNSFSQVTDANYQVSTALTNDIIDYTGTISGASGSSAGTNGNACVTAAGCTAGAFTSLGGNKGKCTVTLTNTAIPNNGIIFVANNAWVEGTINNVKVTIVAAELPDEPGYTGGNKDIFLGMNNVSYTNATGSDIIGLIAQDNVTLVRDSLNDLTVDGALLAQSGRVGRCYYDGYVRNSITINGSMATNIRYGFGYTDNTGYLTRNLNFDNNLLYYPPPFFPTGTQYAIDLWNELK